MNKKIRHRLQIVVVSLIIALSTLFGDFRVSIFAIDLQNKVSNNTIQENASKSVDFNVEAIVNTGIKDVNFARAIYDSIVSQPDAFLDNQSLNNNNYSTMKDLLNNFNGDINAYKYDIKSIEGFQLLRSSKNIDLSFNQINNIKPISVTDAIDESNISEEARKFYGTRGIDTKINLMGNPIREYPAWLGGRIVLTPSLSVNQTLLNDKPYSYIVEDEDSFNKQVTIPLDLKYANNQKIDLTSMYLEDGSIWEYQDDILILNNSLRKTGAKLVGNVEGKIDNITINNITSSGFFSVDFASTQKSSIHYYRVRNISDRLNPEANTLSWSLPVEIKMYTQVSVQKSKTNHLVTLAKKGLDDDALKPNAVYSLYKKVDTNIDANKDIFIDEYKTNKNGIISVNHLSEGNYYFKENSNGAPEGYDINLEPVEFTLKDTKLIVEGGKDSVTPVGGSAQNIANGQFVAGGEDGTEVTLRLENGDDAEIESLILKWSKGKGSAGSATIKVGTGTDKADTFFVKTKDEALKKASELLKERRKLYQNTQLEPNFIKKINLEQKDPLKPIDIKIEASKILLNPKGNVITPIPEFNFSLINDPNDVYTPELNLVAKNNKDGEINFTINIGNDIGINHPLNSGVYEYNYILKEVTSNDIWEDDLFSYDKTEWKVTVRLIKESTGLKLAASDGIVFKKDGVVSDNAKFINIEKLIPLSFQKIDEKGSFVSKAGFTLFKCNSQHTTHGADCIWDKNQPIYPEVVSGTDGIVTFEKIAIDAHYILVETSVPDGFEPLDQNSFISVNIDVNGDVIMTGYGDFEKNGMINKDEKGTYQIKNINKIDTILPQPPKPEKPDSEINPDEKPISPQGSSPESFNQNEQNFLIPQTGDKSLVTFYFTLMLFSFIIVIQIIRKKNYYR